MVRATDRYVAVSRRTGTKVHDWEDEGLFRTVCGIKIMDDKYIADHNHGWQPSGSHEVHATATRDVSSETLIEYRNVKAPNPVCRTCVPDWMTGPR
jgi:hypothetical protein